nr:TerD family protein [Yimella sp. cx-51]
MLADLKKADPSLRLLSADAPVPAPIAAPPPSAPAVNAIARAAPPVTVRPPTDPYAHTPPVAAKAQSALAVSPASIPPVAAVPIGPVGVVRHLDSGPTTLVRGANIQLAPSALPQLRVKTTWQTPSGSGLDVSALALDGAQRAASESHFVFYGNPRSPDGALAVRSSSPGTATVEIVIGQLPTWVEKVVVIASVDPAGTQITFASVQHLVTTVHAVHDQATLAGCDSSSGATQETAMLLCEFYRRNDAWRFRAVGQGFFDGLAGVIRTFGLQTA